VSYTADANYVPTTTATPLTYDQLRSLVAKFELSPFFDPTNAVAIAHPAFKDSLRGIKDTQGHPIFTDPIGGAASTFFGYDMKFSLGAKTSAVATDAPTGNPLIVLGEPVPAPPRQAVRSRVGRHRRTHRPVGADR
jgi:HK97 family phage major capsid protein